MGIKNFNKWIKNNFPKCFITKDTGDKFYYLYVDLNYLLHIIAFKSDDEDSLLLNLDRCLKSLIKRYNSKSIHLFCDGSAPLAKLLLQRKRRLYTLNNSLTNFNSLHFTPSTIFMKKLEDFLNGKKKTYMLYYRAKMFLDIGNYDESEIKISKKIRENSNDEKHLVISSDADMILILAGINGGNNIFLTAIDNSDILNIGKLVSKHSLRFGSNINDFIFLNLLLGNDYIPKVSCLTIDKIWENYQIIKSLDNQYVINDDENININTFCNLLDDCGIKTPKQFTKNDGKIELINFNALEEYWKGLNWCFIMYKSGHCPDYKFMYPYNYIPGPHTLSLFLNTRSSYKTVQKFRKPLNPNLYGFLILPEEKVHYLNFKINFEIPKDIENVIYEVERCNECVRLGNKIKELTFRSKQNLDDKILRRDSLQYKNELAEHKNSHSEITLKQILILENLFEENY
jgi:5'-3' exonuclease